MYVYVCLCVCMCMCVCMYTCMWGKLTPSSPPPLPRNQRCVPCPSQGDEEAICHEEGQQASDGHEETGPASILREGHPHLCRESIRGGDVVHLPDQGE